MVAVDLCTVTWITISAVATLIMVIISFTLLIRPILRRPKFSIEYGIGVPFYIEASSSSFKAPESAVRTYWVRLRVKNTGKSVAKRCLGKLVKVMDEDGKEKSEYDPMPLHWVITSWKAVPFQTIDLNRDESEYLNVFAAQSNNPVLYLAGDQFPWAEYEQRAILNSLPYGKYILGITVYGDDVKPETKYLSLIWHGTGMEEFSLELHDDLRKAKSWLKKRGTTLGVIQPDLDTSKNGLPNVLPEEYITSQTPTYFLFGVILVYVTGLTTSVIWQFLLGLFAIIALSWTLCLWLVAFKLPDKLKRLGALTRFSKLIVRYIRKGYGDLIYPFASFTVLVTGYIMIISDLVGAGIGIPIRLILLGLLGLLILLNIVFVYYVGPHRGKRIAAI